MSEWFQEKKVFRAGWLVLCCAVGCENNHGNGVGLVRVGGMTEDVGHWSWKAEESGFGELGVSQECMQTMLSFHLLLHFFFKVKHLHCFICFFKISNGVPHWTFYQVISNHISNYGSPEVGGDFVLWGFMRCPTLLLPFSLFHGFMDSLSRLNI